MTEHNREAAAAKTEESHYFLSSPHWQAAFVWPPPAVTARRTVTVTMRPLCPGGHGRQRKPEPTQLPLPLTPPSTPSRVGHNKDGWMTAIVLFGSGALGKVGAHRRVLLSGGSGTNHLCENDTTDHCWTQRKQTIRQQYHALKNNCTTSIWLQTIKRYKKTTVQPTWISDNKQYHTLKK